MVGAGRQMAVRRWQEVYRPAVRLGEPGSDGFHRSWIMLMPEGMFRHPEYGRLAFTRRKLLEFKRHFDAKVRKIDIALDRDHDAKAATGWLEQVEYRAARDETPAGLWGRIRWTSLGVRLLKEQIYRYFSPEFGSYPDEESGRTWENVLIGGAL
ncbi:MAG TPA: phage protease, partial [Ktedonobacterales bacterium]